MPLFDPVQEDGCYRVNKGNFNFKYDEYERDNIESHIEVDPGAASRRLTAFIRCEFARVGVARGEQLLQPEHRHYEDDRDNGEGERYAKLKVHNLSSESSCHVMRPAKNCQCLAISS